MNTFSIYRIIAPSIEGVTTVTSITPIIRKDKYKMANRFTPEQLAEKQMRRTKAATQDMVAGVNAVEVAPSTQAIAKKQKAVQNWNDAMNSGKWERGLKRVTLDDWKKAMVEKGVARVAAGVDAAKDKLTAFYAELIPFQADLSKKIEVLPDLTVEDSIQRAATWIRGMSNFRKSK